MTNETGDLDITITHDSHFNNSDIYRISTELGGIDAVYHPKELRYTIANIDVYSHRRRGVGKELLRVSQSHARELGARVIFAAIISRECLDAMTSVFGEEFIYTSQVGTYAPAGADYGKVPTSAVLHVVLED